MNPGELRTIGIIVAAHGLQGTAKVESLSGFPERFLTLKTCFAVRGDSVIAELSLKRVKLGVRHVLMTFREITTRDEIEKMRGCEICIPNEISHPLPKDTFYISDLIGYSGVDSDGKTFGTLKSVHVGAQDMLTFKTAQGELLVPFVETWVGKIDSVLRTIEVPEWTVLLESQMTAGNDHRDD
jgi:16S rRNA processing protein RimM